MLAKLNKIKNWQAAIVIAVLGFAVYSVGLTNTFQGDDYRQILNSLPVHSITHIKILFEGGTFYNGQGLAPLSGTFYRPLMTTAFSLIYTLFGPHPLYFHLFQLLLCIGSTVFLYLLFKYSFRPTLALFLSLVFLIHPIDSSIIYAIPTTQDALFFFFGILAIYLLVRFNTTRSLFVVALCILLSLLSKETGVLFLLMALIYLFWWDRKRLYPFVVTMIVPVALYLTLKINAVGLSASNPYNAPIDFVSLGGRLMTDPSIFLFYIGKIVFPWKLSSSYYWVYPTFSIQHFLVPLAIDLGIIGLFVYLGFLIHKVSTKADYYTYLFFSIWTSLGLLACLQIIPLDFTASEWWFYFPMAGLLGMIGVIFTVFYQPYHPELLLVAAVLILGAFGIRTVFRGLEWRSVYSLAVHDIAASGNNYNAYNAVATYYISKGDYSAAKPYAERSTEFFQTYTNLTDLGLILSNLGDYEESASAYYASLKYNNSPVAYENIAALTLVFGNPATDRAYLTQTIIKFPNNSSLWLYLALFDSEHNISNAKADVINAAKYGQVPQGVYYAIMNGQPTRIDLANIPDGITIQ